MPPVVDLPRRALGSAGGGASTERETIFLPRTIVKPRVRFSSWTTVCDEEPAAPGAAGLLCFLILRNSSVSARTRFMCCQTKVNTQDAKFAEDRDRAHLVEGQHLSGHLATILKSDSHPVIDLNQVHQYYSWMRQRSASRKVLCSWENVRNRPGRRGRVSLLMSTLLILNVVCSLGGVEGGNSPSCPVCSP